MSFSFSDDLVRAIGDAVIVLDERGQIVFANPATYRLLGYEPVDLLGKKLGVICADEDSATRTIQMLPVETGDELRREELDFRAKDGEEIPVGVLGTAILDDESFLAGIVLVARDLRETRALFAELERARDDAHDADRAKSAFLASMSHEIRNPLGAVLGFTELLMDTTLAREQRNWVETISAAATSLLGVLNDVLDISKIESGMVELEQVDFDLHKTLSLAVDMFAPAANGKGVDLALHISPRAPRFAHGDPTRLRQILVNLVSNAIKFTEKGRVEVRVDAETVPETGADEHFELDVDVHDTGPGISPERQGALFEAFVQEDATTTRRFGGSGLGLAISKSFVELMNGTIGVESIHGVGSRFWFRVSLGSAVRDETATPPPVGGLRPSALRGASRSGRVLIVEDNALNQLVTERMINKLGYVSDVVDNGVDAVTAAASVHYDVILMDSQLPKLSGNEATRQIRASQIRHVPIIALSGAVSTAERQSCLDAGTDAFVAKPFQLADLQAAFAEVLGRRRRRESSLFEASPDVSDLDASMLDRLRSIDGGGVSFAREMTELLVDEVQQALGVMEVSNLEKIGAIAHRLKSSAGTIGATRLASLFREIEERTHLEGKDASDLIARLGAELVRAKHAFQAYFASLGPSRYDG